MTTINKLTRTDTVSAGDVVPVYVQNQGDARGAAMSVIAAYVLSTIDISGTDFVTQYALPSVTGFSIQVNNTSENTHLIISPTGSFAAGTIVLPAIANLIEGQQVMVTITQSLTALMITPNGAAIIGAPSSLTANQTFILKYDSASSTWYMVGNSIQIPVTTDTAQTLTNKTISGGVIAGSQLLSVDIGGSSTGVLTGFTGLPIMTGVAGLGAGVATFLATPSSANLAAAVTGETGTGALVFGTSPTLGTPTFTFPVLGSPTSGTLTNCTGYLVSNLSGMAAGISTFLTTPSSAALASAVTDETGSGALVFATSPTLVTPLLGTPTSGNLTNCTGYDLADLVGAAAGVLAFLATPSSANLITAVTDETGSGQLVFATSPTLVTPNIGVATATSLQRQTPVTKTLAFTVAANENWIICNGAGSITVTLPAAASFIGREIMIKTIAAQTVVSASSNVVPLAGGAAGTAILAASAGAWATLVSDGTNWIIMQA